MSLTSERLHQILRYDPVTGEFWRHFAAFSKRVGTLNTLGYIVIRLDDTLYLAHRLAYFYVEGQWPEHEIDHRDMNRANNRWSNLRAATRSQNRENQQVGQEGSTSQKLGVCWHKRKQLWHAQIGYEGRNRHIGYFRTEEEASAAYLKEKAAHHQFGVIPGVLGSPVQLDLKA